MEHYVLKRGRLICAPIIDTAIDTVRPAAEKKSIDIKTSYSSHGQSILCDPDRLQQIVCNLLSNAVKFTPAVRPDYCARHG